MPLGVEHRLWIVLVEPGRHIAHALGYSYQRQLEHLTKVRRGVVDVATSRKRIGLQLSTLERQAAKLTGQRKRALEERVSAIERAEPGATEVRTLAAYVRALGAGWRSWPRSAASASC